MKTAQHKPTSAYVHIPFCTQICYYCDFAKVYIKNQPVDDYITALLEEVATEKISELKTLYIGGGTPTALTAEQLDRLLAGLTQNLDLTTLQEFTVEANPGDLSDDKIAVLKKNHVNRVSLGVQTFNDKLLKKIGRSHNSQDVFDNVAKLRAAGFDNITIDLIYAQPGQTMADVKKDIENILSFEHVFPDAKVIKLEQNYRSTQNILNAANEVIANNQGRKAKRLWTENPEGDLIDLRQFQSGFEEAEYVAGEITRGVRTEGKKYRDYAILYRTNAQSRLFEEKLLLANVPYKIVGGVNFYARREIKDLLAYLRVIENPEDDLAVLRIINVPRRGIGAATINKVQDWEAEQGIRFYDALLEAEYVPGLMRSLNKIKSFTSFLQVLRAKADYLSVKELLNEIIEETGYVADLQAEGTEEAAARIENIDELISKIADYEESAEQPSLGGFLQEVALVSDIDSVDEESDYVLLMTLHSAKGLEFPNVFLAGMEDGIFPSYMTITGDDPSELEEERRLCYVGITRAMQHLTLTCARQRMIRGEVQYNKMSRFVKEIPRELISLERERGEIEDRKPKMDIPTRGSVYAAMKQAFREKPQQAKTFSAQKATKLDYEIGDTVRHIKFGVGIVTDIVDGGRDYEVTVNFDQAGTKKMFASFAKLKKL